MKPIFYQVLIWISFFAVYNQTLNWQKQLPPILNKTPQGSLTGETRIMDVNQLKVYLFALRELSSKITKDEELRYAALPH